MIETVYTVTEEEFAEAQKLWCPHVAKKIPGYWAMQIAGLAFGASIGLSIVRLPAKLGVLVALSFIIYFAIAQWRKRAARKYQYNTKRISREEVSVRFDEEGYHDQKDGCCGGWISWDGFTGWRETPSLFIVGRAATFIPVPKRRFSIEQQEELRSLFGQRIREKD